MLALPSMSGLASPVGESFRGRAMHGLGHIDIEHFRQCRKVSIPIESFTPLVGPNNVGKTTILEAIKYVFAPRTIAKDQASDPDRRIVVCARIDGIGDELLATLAEPRHRAAIEPYCREGSLRIRAVGPDRPKQEVWDPDQYSGEGVPTVWRSYPTGLPEAVSALMPEARHIEALDDIQEDLGKGKAGSTIRDLLDDLMSPVLEAHTEVSDALAVIRRVLSADPDGRAPLLREFDREASGALAEFFPGLGVELVMPEVEVKEFFRSGDVLVTDSQSGERRRFDQLGTGAQRALQMALIRLLADRSQRQNRSPARRVLLIDEPELFLHPQAIICVREALYQLSKCGFQIIFSTHSPFMISRENAADVVIVRRDPEAGVSTRPPMREVVSQAIEDARAQSRVLFELGNVAGIYFSDRVVLCEGKTERRLLPLVARSLGDTASTCFVELGSCSSIPKGLKVLDAMGLSACAIADLDFGFTSARGTRSLLPADDEVMITTREVLEELRSSLGCTLAANSLPQNSSQWPAWKTWAEFTKHERGQVVSAKVHTELLAHRVWIWPVGCIENVLGIEEKGEDAIVEQEERLRSMDINELEVSVPLLVQCFRWLEFGRSEEEG